MTPSISILQRSPSGRMKWRLAGGALVALLIGGLWRAEEVPTAPEVPVVDLTGAAPLTFAPPAAGSGSAGASSELTLLHADGALGAWAIDQPPPVVAPAAAPHGPSAAAAASSPQRKP
jgi:hypothetical protein